MRTLGAIVAALFGAVLGFFIVGFLSCLVAIAAESVALGFVAVALAIAAAIGGGYLGAKAVLGQEPSNRIASNMVRWNEQEIDQWAGKKDEDDNA